MSLLPLTDTDLQAGAPAVRLPLDRAGVVGVVRGLLLPGNVACTATISLTAGVAPDVYSYQHAINACAKAAHWRKALALLEAMAAVDVKPDVYIYATAMSACG